MTYFFQLKKILPVLGTHYKKNLYIYTSITPFVGDERASEIVSLARAKLRRGISNNLCSAPY